MGPAELTEYVEHASEVLAASSELGMRNTQLRLVEPFLETLGWNVRAPEVEAAYEVTAADVRVDYALLADGRPAVFVLTEPCEDTLEAEARRALLDAMREMEVGWGVLTNGRRFAFVGRRDGRDEWVESSLAELPETTTVLERFTRASALERARSRSRAERATAAEQLAGAGEDLVDDLVAELLETTDGAAAADIETATREFVRRLTRSFQPDDEEGARQPSTAPTDVERSASPTDDSDDDSEPDERGATADRSDDDSDGESNQTAEGVRTVATASAGSDGEYVARFFRDRTSVGAVGSSTVAGTMAQVVDYLIEHHHLSRSVSLPYCPADDGMAVLHYEPTHPTGEPMRPAVELDTGPYLWTGGDVEAQRTRLEDLASRAGLRVMFQGDWSPR
ncbi:hypothetical protein [Haloarchaeobius sp. TZWSO28]|uniref:hypothetical protein n=1 Tax=Haloarchaeobius sp. TZWSO28 TaxID=3446119 RepID=UPI003EB9C3F3